MSDQNDGQNREEQRTRTFNPNEHLMQLKSSQGSKDYLPVQWRLVWFRSICPEGTIDTEELEYELDREVEAETYVWNSEKRRSEKVIKKARGYARYRAVVTDGKGGRATGTKSENAANFADYGEKAETGSIGRALAALGYGTQFAPDLDEEHRIVDTPVSNTESSHTHPGGQQDATASRTSDALSTRVKALSARAREVGIDDNVKWASMLRYLDIGKIKGEAEIALIEAYLTQEAEKREKTTF